MFSFVVEDILLRMKQDHEKHCERWKANEANYASKLADPGTLDANKMRRQLECARLLQEIHAARAREVCDLIAIWQRRREGHELRMEEMARLIRIFKAAVQQRCQEIQSRGEV